MIKDKEKAATQLKKAKKRFLMGLACFTVLLVALCAIQAYAATKGPGISIDFFSDANSDKTMGALDALFLFVLIALLPSILLMATSFTRIIIVLSFMRNALGTQQSPPNSVLLGIALLLTLFIMTPTINDIKEVAYDPYKAGTITQAQALEKGAVPLKTFMIKQTDVSSLNLFISLSKVDLPPIAQDEPPEALLQLPFNVVLPSFITSELKTAFRIGFLLYLPFLIIDIVVSSVLMSMGMVMLPPAMISLPFKILMFVLMDGWTLLFGTIAAGFT
ncbi:MAG: flagellar type III secretion system pore protein FliP [Oscillospiraceae bacterium]